MDLDLILVTVAVKTCSIEQIDHEIAKKFANQDYKDDVVVRDIAGVVIEVGSEVSRFQIGDDVIGVLPINQYFNIKLGTCQVPEYQLVNKPSQLSWEIASSCLMDGLRAYNALHYLGRLRPGDTLLICNASSPFGILTIQLALERGVKVFATSSNEDEAKMLRSMSLDVERMLSGHEFMRNIVMDETGGLGVDCVIDSGVTSNHKELDERDFKKPMKHDVLFCLAVLGRWVTSQSDLQIDPPDSEILRMKNASLCHLFTDALTISKYRQNQVLHILTDVMKKAESGVLRPHLMSVLPASEFSSSLFPSDNRIVLKL